MNYENKELNIFIENAEYFDIHEFANDVQLNVNKKIMYIVFAGSRIKANSVSCIEAHGNSQVKVYNDARVLSYDKSCISAYDQSSVDAFNKSTVDAHGMSSVVAYGTSHIKAYGCSTISAHGRSKVVAYNNSSIAAYKKSNIEAYNDSRVRAYSNASVKAYENSHIVAYENSHILASGFSVVYVRGKKPVIVNNHYGAIIQQVFEVKEDMVVFKKLAGGLIAELELKKGQIFQSEYHYTCRTDSAKVLRITGVNGEELQKGFSQLDKHFVYRVGEIVTSEYDPEIRECSKGIHFFLNRKSAENY